MYYLGKICYRLSCSSHKICISNEITVNTFATCKHFFISNFGSCKSNPNDDNDKMGVRTLKLDELKFVLNELNEPKSFNLCLYQAIIYTHVT